MHFLTSAGFKFGHCKPMRQLPQKIIEGLSTKSAKILALAEAGYERTEIASFLKIRYQHVRNVLLQKNFSGGLAGDALYKTSQKIKSVSQVTDSKISRSAGKPVTADFLLTKGFQFLGNWHSVSPYAFKLDAIAPSDAGIYVFVVDGFINYIGITRNSLKIRLGHYVYGHVDQKTSARIKGLILAALTRGSAVEVLVAIPPALEWNDLPINTAVGLESGLIALIQPPWNIHRAG